MTHEHKSPGLAAALSVILPGAGHIYIDDVGVGIAYLLLGIFGYILFVFPGIIVAVASAIHANDSAKKKNSERESEGKEKGDDVATAKVSPDEFVDRLEKLKDLHGHGMLDDDEYELRKGKSISDLENSGIEGDPEDFLFEIKELKGEVLKDEEVKDIKGAILT